LSDFERVRQSVVKYVTAIGGHYLGHFGETGKSAGVEKPIAVDLGGCSIV
jgi:hypothetical protein